MLHPGSIRKAQIAVNQEIVLCDKHKEKVTIFCKNCNDLVCAECIVDSHNGHNLKRVNDIVGEKCQELKSKLNSLETIQVPEIKKSLDETRFKKSQSEINRKELIDSINNRADELVADVNEARSSLLEEVKRLNEEDNDKLMKIENKLEELLIEKEEIITLYKRDLTSVNDSKIVQITLELDKQGEVELDELNTDIKQIKRYVFIPGNDESLRDIFGRCIGQKRDISNKKQSVSTDHVIEKKMEIASEFQHKTEKGSVIAITSVDDQAWVATFHGTDVKNVDKSGKVHKVLTFTTKVSDLAATDDGCLLVAPNGGSDGHEYQIKKVKHNGEIVTLIDTKPLRPNCICTSPTGHLYVGCSDGFNYNVADKNTRSVIKLSCDGKKLKTWQYDERHEMIFTLPTKVQTNEAEMIWVRDRTADSRGRVVVLHDKEDGVRFIYNGVKNNNITVDFNPSDLTAAGDGTMLISDTNNHIIHGVDKNGVLLYLLGLEHKTRLHGITSFCLNRRDNALWIGNLKGHVQVFRLK